jgi:hypothetical protein
MLLLRSDKVARCGGCLTACDWMARQRDAYPADTVITYPKQWHRRRLSCLAISKRLRGAFIIPQYEHMQHPGNVVWSRWLTNAVAAALDRSGFDVAAHTAHLREGCLSWARAEASA